MYECVGGVRWRLREGLDAREVSPLLGAALEALASGAARSVKTGRRKALYLLFLRRGDAPDFLLRCNRYPWHVALRRLGRPSRSAHELEMAERLHARGLPLPLPLAAGERRRGPLLKACYLLIPVVDGAADVLHLAWEGGLPQAARCRLATALGALSRRAHDAGFFQDDFAPNNFLVRPEAPGEPMLIDFERAHLQRHVDAEARGRMLAKLDRALPLVSKTDRLRFLLAYTGHKREEARIWWRRLEGVTHRLLLRDLKRLGRLTTRDGPRFLRVREGPWEGWAQHEVATSVVRALVADTPERAEEDATVVYQGVSAREARALWVMANLLARRALGAPALALLHRRGEARLLLEATAFTPTPEEAAAGIAHLRRRLAAWGDPPAHLAPTGVIWARDPRGRPMALLRGPRGFCPRVSVSRCLFR
ncbi:MAG TPA: lipopolysaccharide kinase InaA family protein [Myxococcota bacterium]|nr:lipopolysaccharide kinase InaA family protein [Myxococcota bacterium]